MNLNSGQRLAASFVVLFVAVVSMQADTVILKGGHKVSGHVLKSDKNAVVVDLGFEVLRLPRSKVVRIEKDQGKTANQM